MQEAAFFLRSSVNSAIRDLWITYVQDDVIFQHTEKWGWTGKLEPVVS